MQVSVSAGRPQANGLAGHMRPARRSFPTAVLNHSLHRMTVGDNSAGFTSSSCISIFALQDVGHIESGPH